MAVPVWQDAMLKSASTAGPLSSRRMLPGFKSRTTRWLVCTSARPRMMSWPFISAFVTENRGPAGSEETHLTSAAHHHRGCVHNRSFSRCGIADVDVDAAT
jgi:hypothetical protein